MSGSGSHTNTWPTNKVLNYKLSMDSMIRDVPSGANKHIHTQHYTCKMLDEIKYRTGGGCEWYEHVCWECHSPTHSCMVECETKNIVHIISSECHSHFLLPSMSLLLTTSLKHCAHFTAQSNTNYPITNFHRKSFKRTITTRIPCETSNSLSFKRNRYLSLVMMTQGWAQYGQIG